MLLAANVEYVDLANQILQVASSIKFILVFFLFAFVVQFVYKLFNSFF